jgi:hypothetical protein
VRRKRRVPIKKARVAAALARLSARVIEINEGGKLVPPMVRGLLFASVAVRNFC